MIKVCTSCGGLYSDTGNEAFGGNPCRCNRVGVATPVSSSPAAWEVEKIEQLARLQRQVNAAVHCISMGRIVQDDYLRMVPGRLMVIGDFVIVDLGTFAGEARPL